MSLKLQRLNPQLPLMICLLTACSLMGQNEEQYPYRWFKGNTHTHTLWSDGDDFPEMVADWYAKNGYNFLGLSDHNILSQNLKWMKLSTVEKRGGKEAMADYLATYGKDWVEQRKNPESGEVEIRLKPFHEYRSLVEEKNKFIMIQAEEITHRHAHINAINLVETIQPVAGNTRKETIVATLRAVQEQANAMGREILTHLNHPNFQNVGISAEDLASITEERFFELFNGHGGVLNHGSSKRHSTEMLWDITSTLRIKIFKTSPMFGIGTDDAHSHHSRGGVSVPGRGWVMVRARYLTPETIIRAMRNGDFYSSSGVELDDINFNEETRTLSFKILAEDGVNYKTKIVGSTKDADMTPIERKDPKTDKVIEGLYDYGPDVGKTFAEFEGTTVEYKMTGDELYIRAVVTSDKKPARPFKENQWEMAWTQPVGWLHHVQEQVENASNKTNIR